MHKQHKGMEEGGRKVVWRQRRGALGQEESGMGGKSGPEDGGNGGDSAHYILTPSQLPGITLYFTDFH